MNWEQIFIKHEVCECGLESLFKRVGPSGHHLSVIIFASRNELAVRDESTSITSSTSREDLNSKFRGESFILKNNQNINSFLMQEFNNEKKSVIITTKRPNKNSVIISSYQYVNVFGTTTASFVASHNQVQFLTMF